MAIDKILLVLSAIFAGISAFIFFGGKKKATESEIKQSVEEWTNTNGPIGKILGYPDCCVKEFCEASPLALENGLFDQKDVEKRYEAAHIDGKYTGFIPCKAHAEQILNKEITLESLIKDRDSDFPSFPDWGV